MGLNPNEDDPQHGLEMEKVDRIMQAWKERFLAKPEQQYALHGEQKREPYWVGAPLPARFY